jgi:hypothetical protein
MSATDSATDLYAESIDRLRARDRVSPVERLRRETFALLGQIPPARNGGEVEAALPALALHWSSLAVALALPTTAASAAGSTLGATDARPVVLARCPWERS